MLRRLAPLLILLASSGGSQTWEKYVAQGVTYRMEFDGSLPRVMHALRVRLGAPGLYMQPALAENSVYSEANPNGRGGLSKILGREEAIAGVNGDFFPFTGDPLGAMMRDGELISAPYPRRAVFAWGVGGSKAAVLNWTASVDPGDGAPPIKIDALNTECPENSITLDTDAAGLAKAKPPNVYALLRAPQARWSPTGTEDAQFEYFFTDVPTIPVQEGNAMLVARGSKVKQLLRLKQGRPVTITMRTTGLDWTLYEQAIGGGPFLLRGGNTAIDWKSAGFKQSFAEQRHPRTAIGRTAVGDLWLVTIDGRQSMSIGATLPELARVMRRLGCVDAINLDGGGSTTLGLFGSIMNRPSDGEERKIANGLVLKLDLPVASVEQNTIRGPASAEVGKPVSFELIGSDGSAVPNSQVFWSATGAGWIDQGGTLRPIRPGSVSLRAVSRGQISELSLTVSAKPLGVASLF